MRSPIALCFSILLAACSGGGGGDNSANPNPAPPPPAVTQQSPGGIWHAFAGPGASPLNLFIAEDGDMRVMGSGPTFGSGALVVTAGNRVSGSYDVRGIQPNPTSPAAVGKHCTVDGTVTERVSLQVEAHCTDDNNVTTVESLSLLFDQAYTADSSLAAIAGNYTLSFNSPTNSLTINGDGALFGVFHNGAQCTVNGQAKVIDANFNLYEFDFLFSNCQVFPRYEGQTMTGFAALNLPGMPADSFLLLITGVIEGRLEFFSVLYEPV